MGFQGRSLKFEPTRLREETADTSAQTLAATRLPSLGQSNLSLHTLPNTSYSVRENSLLPKFIPRAQASCSSSSAVPPQSSPESRRLRARSRRSYTQHSLRINRVAFIAKTRRLLFYLVAPSPSNLATLSALDSCCTSILQTYYGT